MRGRWPGYGAAHGKRGKSPIRRTRVGLFVILFYPPLVPPLVEAIRASALRRLGKPTLIGYGVLLVVVGLGVAVSAAWMRWGPR